ncbi:putative short-subunit dehydrogenase-like oxidoreductase (DUF2520 family) [Desulfobotulus alkaliphilus]|uniref:Putative short-subunit dehydrogenase-like oxidoreductase (DUF2520 family) n=1 Tax=Desulfobotulus alkaliphilus TaxID=622671 RepID=A0A562RD01_9BACT|nr:Rossmann-like and DUF2520 domain-containing protein [Desulfobotulus alkaliphilus]TWI66912.1 putative short-subunit dehydrogenase-like oxidoreductase (DUF2520 family) [Desulfobotulus alkaliphilus]
MTQQTGIIGCGRAGSHLAFHLKKAGWSVCGIWDAEIKKAEQIAALTEIPLLSPEEMGQKADILVLALPDDTIASACDSLAAKGIFHPGQRVFHLSGSQPAALLVSAAKKGAFTASLHPLQSFSPSLDRGHPFKNILMTAEGMPEAVETGLAMAEDLGAKGIPIAADAKVLYHAAAVVASNYLVTLLDFSFDLLEASGIEGSHAMAFLAPLISGTLANLEKMPAEAALTGPVVRGDTSTLKRHLEAISEKRPLRSDLYKALGRATLDLAVRGKHLDKQAERQIHPLFSLNGTLGA